MIKMLILYRSNYYTVKKMNPTLTLVVIEDEKILHKWIEQYNYFYNYSIQHKAILDNSKKQINIIYYINVQTKVNFGDITFIGHITIIELYLYKLINIKKEIVLNVQKFIKLKQDYKKAAYFQKLMLFYHLRSQEIIRYPLFSMLKNIHIFQESLVLIIILTLDWE